jgi:hypothetical protein
MSFWSRNVLPESTDDESYHESRHHLGTSSSLPTKHFPPYSYTGHSVIVDMDRGAVKLERDCPTGDTDIRGKVHKIEDSAVLHRKTKWVHTDLDKVVTLT